MEIIIIIFISASIGALMSASSIRDARFTGAIVIPAVTVIVTTVIWVAMLWMGAGTETVVMWILPAVIGTGAGLVVAVAQKTTRPQWAQRRLTELTRR